MSLFRQTDDELDAALSEGFCTPPNDAEIKVAALRARFMSDVPALGWHPKLAMPCTNPNRTMH